MYRKLRVESLVYFMLVRHSLASLAGVEVHNSSTHAILPVAMVGDVQPCAPRNEISDAMCRACRRIISTLPENPHRHERL